MSLSFFCSLDKIPFILGLQVIMFSISCSCVCLQKHYINKLIDTYGSGNGIASSSTSKLPKNKKIKNKIF